MQEYREVLETSTIQEARTIWNNNLNTLRSTHAGEAFPTENLVLGMKCFRSDEKKTYTLVSLDPPEWAVEASGSGGVTPELVEEIKQLLMNSQTYLGFVGKEAIGRLTDWTGLFNRAFSLESVDFSDLGTGAYVKSMSMMFHECMSLKTVFNFIIPRDHVVKDVHGMFSGCSALTALDVTGVAARNVENFADMFSDCHEIRRLDVSKWQTGRAQNMRGLFRGCRKLESLDVSKWDVSKCTNFAEMFRDCHVLRGLDFSKWNTSKATAMGGMFQGCGNNVTAMGRATNLDLSVFDLSKVETTAKMFASACAKLTIGENMRKTGKCTNMREMFARFIHYEDVAIAGRGYAPSVMGTDYRGIKCKQTIFTAFDYSSAEDMSGMFEGAYAVNCVLGMGGTGDGNKNANGLIFHVSTPKVQNIMRMFCSASGAEFIDFSMDTGRVTSMIELFSGSGVTSIRFRAFDTRNLYEQWGQLGNTYTGEGMFRGCRNLRYLIIDGTEFKFKLLKDILADLPSECRFIVPRSMIPTYKAQEHWKNYGDRFVAMEDCTLIGAYVYSAPE